MSNPDQQNTSDIKQTLIEALEKTHGIGRSGYRRPIEKISISSDGHWLVTRADNIIYPTALLWNLMNENPFEPRGFTYDQEIIDFMTFSHDNRWLVTASTDGTDGTDGTHRTVKLLDLNDPYISATSCEQIDHKERISSMTITPNSRWLVIRSKTSKNRKAKNDWVHIWDLSDPCNKDKRRSFKHDFPVNAVTLSPDSCLLVTVSRSRTIDSRKLQECDPPFQSAIYESNKFDLAIQAVQFSPDQRWFIFNSGEEIRLQDLNRDSGEENVYTIDGLELDDSLAVIISDDSHWLIATNLLDNTIRLWDLTADNPTEEKKRKEMILGDGNEVTAMSISPDSRWLLTGGVEGHAYLSDLKAEEPPKEISLNVNQTDIKAVAISCLDDVRDSGQQWVVMANQNGDIYLWDCNTMRHMSDMSDMKDKNQSVNPRITLKSHEGAILDIAITNNYLVSRSEDGAVRLWDLKEPSKFKRLSDDFTLEELKADACLTAGRNLTQEEWDEYFQGEAYRQTCQDLPLHYTVDQ